MRAFTLLNATKVSITALALVVSLTGFADARDRHGDRNHHRRPQHHAQQHRDRTETLSGVTAGHRHHHDRRDRRHVKRKGEYRLVGRTDYHRRGEYRYGETRFSPDRRPNRRIIPRQYRGDNRNYWEPAYREGTGGAYLGGLSAWREPGNGTYFSSERYGYDHGYQPYEDNNGYRGHRAKIIHVNPSSAGRACSWESGVCVIRR
ncbi:hypothetical protein [Pararhizobium sp. O133]|uniref:hypothetical protein n=1 Tax=Pararhizobium sp. O133 TaxID=3449278 RepID=UPI003F685BFA